ncbi:Uncharacterised protein [Vibrio cholerae]|nr:Uncharacterised protein [Vibrio cholerae]
MAKPYVSPHHDRLHFDAFPLAYVDPQIQSPRLRHPPACQQP